MTATSSKTNDADKAQASKVSGNQPERDEAKTLEEVQAELTMAQAEATYKQAKYEAESIRDIAKAENKGSREAAVNALKDQIAASAKVPKLEESLEKNKKAEKDCTSDVEKAKKALAVAEEALTKIGETVKTTEANLNTAKGDLDAANSALETAEAGKVKAELDADLGDKIADATCTLTILTARDVMDKAIADAEALASPYKS